MEFKFCFHVFIVMNYGSYSGEWCAHNTEGTYGGNLKNEIL